MTDAETLGSRAVAAARSNFALTPLIALAGLVSSVVLIRTLAPQVFALYALAVALRGSVQLLADLGTGAASARVFAQLQDRGARDQAQRVYLRLLTLRGGLVVMGALTVALWPDAFARILDLEDDERYFLAFVVLICAAEVGAGLGYYVLMGLLRHGIANRVVLGQNVLQPIAVIVAAASGAGLRGILAVLLTVSLGRAVALNAGAVRALRAIRGSAERLEGVAQSYARVATGSLIGKVAGWLHSRQFITPVAFSVVSRPQIAVFSITYDWAHQVLTVVSAPIYSLLLPLFAARGERESADLFQFVIRTLSLIVLPIAAVLLAAFPAFTAVVFPEQYEDAYGGALDFAAIIIPCFALEVVLSGPAASFMLAHERFLRAYRRIKVATVLVAGVYFAVASLDLLVVTAIMMGARLASALGLHVAIWRESGRHVDILWLVRAVVASLLCGGAGAVAGQLVPGTLADLAVVPIVGLAVFLALVPATRLLRAGDVAIARRVLPFGHRALEMLSRA